jgi:CDP-6-deoxy-D-xylo-4-hexulose-3-dehydrase
MSKAEQALDLAYEYGQGMEELNSTREFIPGETPIPASGKIVGGQEVANAVQAALDMWFTEGHFVQEFEAKIAKMLGRRYATMCNSGSSANLLALNAVLDVYEIPRSTSTEVITPAAGFPTTIAPMVQAGLAISFCDVDLETYVPSIEMIEAVLTDNTRIIMLAHTLGNPAPLDPIIKLCKERDIVLIEDNCDALYSTYGGKMTGTFGAVSTQSLYPAHHITAGEGGVVFTDRPIIDKYVRKYRDWGRSCWCAPGEENTCGKRFCQTSKLLPEGYDHKYMYDVFGYNLKSTDFQGAIALAQLDRIEDFAKARRMNFKRLWAKMFSNGLQEYFILPEATPGSDPCWFGFPLTIRDERIDRLALIEFLTSRKIGTRLLFAGNILRQPVMENYTIALHGYLDELSRRFPNTEKITRDTFWIGLWPGINEEMIEYMVESIKDFTRVMNVLKGVGRI